MTGRAGRLLVATALLCGCAARGPAAAGADVAVGTRDEKTNVVHQGPALSASPDDLSGPSAPMQLAWSVEMRHFDFIPWAPVETAGPVVVGDRVYAATARGQALYAFDVHSGVERWVFHPRARIEATPAVGGGRAYVATAKGILWGVSADTGAELWHLDIGGISTSRLLYDETADQVVVPTGDNKVHCVDAKTGVEKWVYRREPPSDLTIWGTSSPLKVALSTGDAYVLGFSDGTLVAVKAANGTPVWEQRLVSGGRFRDVDGQVAADGNRLYVTAYADSLYALDRDSGRVLWSAPPGGATGVTLANGKLYHGTDTGDLVARDPADGRELWRWHLPAGVSTTPVVGGAYLFVASSAKTFYAVRADNGTLAWTFEPDYRVAGGSAQAAVSGRRVFFVSNVGTVYAFDPQTTASHYIGTWDSGTHRR